MRKRRDWWSVCVLCGGNRDETDHLLHCEEKRVERDGDERAQHDQAGADPRDIPGTVSHRREMAKEKGWDE